MARSRFTDRSVLITGAAGGIGAAAAVAFAREGARVALADRDPERAEAVAAAIRRDGAAAIALEVDVSEAASVERMVEQTVSAHGGLHVAFNNAGIPSAMSDRFEDLSPDDWQSIIDVNLTGPFLCMRAEIPAMLASGGGAIVNTASIQSLSASRGMPGYIASKHGVAGLTKAAALDLIDRGIRVNGVCPGFIETPMLAPLSNDPGIRSALEAKTPAGRIGTAEEVAEAVLFLASDDASYAVGSLLSIDGGLAVL